MRPHAMLPSLPQLSHHAPQPTSMFTAKVSEYRLVYSARLFSVQDPLPADASTCAEPGPKSSKLFSMCGGGGIRDHGDGTYEASYVASVAGEVQLVVGLHGNAAKTVFKAACLPATIAPGMCEVQLGMAEITAGQPGQLRFWTADRWEPVSRNAPLPCRPTLATSLQHE